MTFSLSSSFQLIDPAFMTVDQVLHPIADSININRKIWDMYFTDLLPRFAKKGSDGNCGSSAVCDTICLQVRIFYFNVSLLIFFFFCAVWIFCPIHLKVSHMRRLSFFFVEKNQSYHRI